MKLLIFYPNQANVPFFCTSVPILCGLAKYKGWEVEYLDTYKYKKEDKETEAKASMGGFKGGGRSQQELKEFNQLVPDLQEKINTMKPDVLAITCMSPEYFFLLSFFGKLQIPSTTKVIIGGIHATLDRDEVIRTGLFDLVVAGEGEATFLDILSRLENKENINSVEGTYFYDRSTKVVVQNQMRPLLPPDRLWSIQRDFSIIGDEYFVKPYDGKSVRRNEVETARGCPFHCTYCGNSALKEFNKNLGKYVKVRPIESSIAEMKRLLVERKMDIFAISDECFLSHPLPWLKEFMDAYKQEINKPYIIITRPETLNEERVTFLLSYGIPFQPSIGVESGSDDIIRMCERSCTTDKIVAAFNVLNKHKVRTGAYFIIGFPFETRADVFKSMELCGKIQPSVTSVHIFQPFPGQKMTRMCIENGFIPEHHVIGTLNSESILTMPPPYLSKKEIKNLWRVFMLYASLPKEYYPDIEKCEYDYDNHQDLFNDLTKLRWEKYDWGKIRGDIKMV